eukprot:5813885-Prymnesium_polylepis.1
MGAGARRPQAAAVGAVARAGGAPRPQIRPQVAAPRHAPSRLAPAPLACASRAPDRPADVRAWPRALVPPQRAPLPLERVHHIHCRHRFASRVLRVGDGVAKDVFEEHFEHAASLLVHKSADAFHTAAPSEPPDRRFRDALDVVAKDLATTFGLDRCLFRPLGDVGE